MREVLSAAGERYDRGDVPCRLARDAEAAAAAKEAEAHKMRPNDDEHSKALQPLEAEANRLTK